MDFLKNFLDYAGLQTYDELIKAYIGKVADSGSAEAERAQAAEQAIIDALGELANGAVAENTAAIELLNGDAKTEGSVANAISKVVAAAPETLDTLKEIADWISNNGQDATNLVTRVADNEEKIEDLKKYVDEQDLAFFNAILSIEDLKIAALFPVVQGDTQSVVEAIAAVEEGKAVQLSADQVVTEDIVIDKACYIDANGSTFEGTVTVPANVEVIIENATFSQPVVVK